MPKASKTPPKPRPKARSSPRKKAISAQFVDDEAHDSDDGVLVDTPTEAPPSSQIPPDQLDTDLEDGDQEDAYEEDFINDGDPYDGCDEPPQSKAAVKKRAGPALTPSPSKRVNRRQRDDDDSEVDDVDESESPRKAKKRASVAVDDVIDIESTSEEDLEAMDEDDSMFRKPSGVKASALPAPLSTRSAAKHARPSSGEAVVKASVQSAPPAQSRAVKSASTAVEEMDEKMAAAMALWIAKYKQDEAASASGAAPELVGNRGSDSGRVDFDQVELEKGIRASLDAPFTPKPKGKGKARASSPSPDWEPPYAGDAFIKELLSSPSKKAAKAVVEPASSGPNRASAGKGRASTSKVGPLKHAALPSGDVSSYMSPIPKPIVSVSAVNSAEKPMTMAQFMRASRGEPEPDDNEADGRETSPPPAVESASTVFLEDLETYKAYYDATAPCGVFDVELQDPTLAHSYDSLPPLPAYRRILPAFDRNRIFGDDSIDYSTGGRVRYSSWYNQLPNMLAQNSMGAMLFTDAEPNFINPSRISPLRLSSTTSTASSTTVRLQIDGRVAVCLTAVCVTQSHVTIPRKIGAKSDRQRKWIAGVPHDYDWERMEALLNLVFGHKITYGQITDKAVSFQTMISPEDDKSKAPPNTPDKFTRSVPASMFSTRSPSKASTSTASTKFRSKTLLAFDDPIPVYDARKVVVRFDTDLDRLSTILPLFSGEIPNGSFAVVGYTCSSYTGAIHSSDHRVPYIGFNLLWVIVCGVPS